MDVLTPEQRQRCMASISGKNTKPELIVRKLLFSMGYRYRLHYSNLPGKPDLVFPGKRKVIFIHGCFWHRHDCKKGKSLPSNNSEFWKKKLAENQSRDSRNIIDLKKQGWNTLVIWECQIGDLQSLADNLHSYLQAKNEEFLQNVTTFLRPPLPWNDINFESGKRLIVAAIRRPIK